MTQWGWCDALAGTGTKLRLELAEDDRVIDIARDSGLRDLVSLADEMIRQSQAQEAALHESRKKLLNDRSLGELPHAELKQYFSEPKDFISDKDRRGWKELRSLALKALERGEPALRRHYYWQIREIAAAIRNNHRSPSPPYMDLLQPPLYYMDYAHNPIAKGNRIASNLKPRSVGRDVPIAPHTRPQLSTLNSQLTNDPLPSTFWVRPQEVRQQDLYHGFGRAELPEFESRLWTYAAPKTSYGGCPGFEAQSGNERIKVKFAETTSEPFTARIFWALGYHVEPTDYVHSLKLKYDRRFFREFHMRKDVQMKVRALFIPLHTINLQVRHDPFDYVSIAVLKDGEHISGSNLKQRLLHDPMREHPEDFAQNCRTEFEQQIDYLITTPANVQTREVDVKSIGPWDFASLDHADRREVRAAGLLGAWLGWFDSRFENTRLKIVQPATLNGRDGAPSPSGPQFSTHLRHYFTDLGGGLGKSIGVLSRHCECPNDFGWRFTGTPHFASQPSASDRKFSSTMAPTGRHANGFRIVDYEPIEDTEAFRQMTIDDARWMARLIAQLTEDQIVQALIASGFDAAEVKLYTEKLASRRDWMLRDLGLDAEFAMLRPHGPDLTLSYNPHRQPLPETRLQDGSRIAARRSLLVVEDGRVLPDKHTRTPLQRLAADQVPSTRNVVSAQRD